MNRHFVLVTIVIAGIFAGASALAQQHRPYNDIMKNVGATFASLKKNLDATGVAAPAGGGGGRGAPPEAAQNAPGAPIRSEQEIRASATAAAEDAAKLQGLFTEVEAFWAPFDTKDAVGFAKLAREAAGAVGAAAKGNDIKAAQASYATIQKSCANCHFAHREETGKGFLIKP